MAMPAWVPETWAKLSEENQKQAGDFLQFLLTQQEKEKKPKNEELFDLLKGQIEIYDNFDDPLPGFEEYMG